MPMPLAKDGAVVFLIGLDVDVREFCAFCRRHLLDVIAGGTPFYTFLLDASGAPRERDAVRALFGDWPRIFERAEDIRDTLLDIVESPDFATRDVSIVVLANRPSSLANDTPFGLLRAELSERKFRAAQFWLIAALLAGPNFEAEHLAGLLTGPEPLFHLVFLLGRDPKEQRYALGPQHAANLRLVVDIARAETVSADHRSARQQLRAAQAADRPRLLWVPESHARVANRMDPALGYVKGALETLATGTQYEQEQAKFARFCAAIIEKVKPDTNELTNTDPDAQPRAKLLDGSGFRGDALQRIRAFGKDFRDKEAVFQHGAQRETKSFIRDKDKRRVDTLTDIRRTASNDLPLPDGGFSMRGRQAIAHEIDAIETRYLDWEQSAHERRATALRQHGELQGRLDPVADGPLNLESVPDGPDLVEALKQAEASAEDLPQNRASLVCLAGAPVALIALTIVFEALDRPDTLDFLTSFAGSATSWLVFVPLCGAAPPIIWLALRSQRARQRQRFTAVRQGADAIHAFICAAMDGTKRYVVETRSALLGRDAVRILTNRAAQEPRAALQREAAQFFVPTVAATLPPVEQQEVRRIVEPLDPEAWGRGLIARGLAQSETAAFWEVEIRAIEAVSGIEVDSGVAFESAIRVGSEWLASNAKVTLPPLPWNKCAAPSQIPPAAPPPA